VLAVMLAEFGPPSVLTPAELPDPVPGPGQAVVEAAFANITFVETQIRAGRPPNPAMAPALPAVLGNGTGGAFPTTSSWTRGTRARRCGAVD
jgi:NADPH2:quinone reductase